VTRSAVCRVLVLATVCCAAPSVPRVAGAAERAPGADTAQVRIGAAARSTGAFVAWPAGKGPFPAVIVVHEWWGLNAQIRGVARRLAQEGYVAIVPDLYRGARADDAEHAHELARGLDESAAVADLRAASSWLASQPRVAAARTGAVGFCMGGRLAQLIALEQPDLDAVVMFYGRPETDPARLARLHAPLQAHFGATDRGIGNDQIEALRNGLVKGGRVHDVHVYSGAGHAFMNEERPSYHADAARQAWARMLQFLQKHLKS
jgi:carboxymethylenebutenolidase